ncbi:hypothetical protein F6X50_04025 [Dickeya dianthicola]|uniref:hypothetical protein n=1 Tax=Dickeya dianthicola TaxID=204039 RepID=UPI0003D6D98D|nr:hypothetical protein [Dickeya dianthicola]ATO33172.1 hypothetical protein DDI_2004 [Dickeya dianthicola RNS04.9]MCA7005515.1 hypothetical protein [Dickeya dianthicola]MCI4155436.1 hypothetical protein [Dickeya dianthicola]MCI4185892.1 hypothetical protein [Dickeya dianthicola]MCI4232551.1 hypothetical protein [Dickeya dianthicola]
MERLNNFCDIVFPVKFYIFFSIVWFFGMEAFFALVTGEKIFFTIGDFLSIFIGFLILFFIRVIDEIKDYEFDIKNNPERPLVKGVISRADIMIYGVTTALLIIILNFLNNNSLLPYTMIIYILFIWFIDKIVNKISVNSFFQLAIAFPASLQIYIYYLFYLLTKYGHGYKGSYIFFVVPFALSFLALEILRKTRWKNVKDGLYSNDIGPVQSHFLGTALGVIGVIICYVKVNPVLGGYSYILWLPVLFLLANAIRFFILKNEKVSIRIFPLFFLIGIYTMNIVLYCISVVNL